MVAEETLDPDASETMITGIFRPLAWLGAPLVALALYVGTWPAVEMKCSKKVSVGWLTRHTPTPTTVTEYASWTGTLYKPLHRLCYAKAEEGVLVNYWNWWRKRLNHEGVPPWELGKP
jgi:hypothetical protein